MLRCTRRTVPAVLVAISLIFETATGERCSTSTLLLHCTSRCAGLDNASAVSSNPPPEQVLAPPQAELLAQLENEARSSGSVTFAQLAESGSPTFPSYPSDKNFTDQTAYAPAHRALTPDQLMALVGPAAAIEWTEVRKATFGCVDGRHAHAGVFSYGGDLGEFALALSVLEHVSQRPIGQAETTQLLEGWLKALGAAGGGFGACVDGAAVTSLGAAVGVADLDMSSPPEEARGALLLRVIAPEFVGNEHLKWQLHYPKTYATRRPLVEQVVRAFYGILWNKYHPSYATVRLHAMSGQRAERAVVPVHTSHWCGGEQGLAPILPSKSRGGSVFVYHPDAVAMRRDALVRYLSAVAAPAVDRIELGARVRTLGDGQAALTEKSLAGMLRSYSLLVK